MMEKSEPAIWSAHLFVDCPHCGEQQDLFEYKDEPKIPFNIEVAECGTDRVQNLEICCDECDEDFIVPDFVW
jgi:hypothetical protein